MTSLVCPRCGAEDGLTILYGPVTSDAERHVREGRAVLGAARLNDGPDRQCRACGQRFYTDVSRQARDEANAAHQQSRLEAMKRGDYQIFTSGQSDDDITDALMASQARRRAKPRKNAT